MKKTLILTALLVTVFLLFGCKTDSENSIIPSVLTLTKTNTTDTEEKTAEVTFYYENFAFYSNKYFICEDDDYIGMTDCTGKKVLFLEKNRYYSPYYCPGVVKGNVYKILVTPEESSITKTLRYDYDDNYLYFYFDENQLPLHSTIQILDVNSNKIIKEIKYDYISLNLKIYINGKGETCSIEHISDTQYKFITSNYSKLLFPYSIKSIKDNKTISISPDSCYDGSDAYNFMNALDDYVNYHKFELYEEDPTPETPVAPEKTLVGTWMTSNGSMNATLEFHEGDTGIMKVYRNNSCIQTVSFKYSESTDYIYITGTSYLNGSKRIREFTATTLTLQGYLAFGFPETCTWTKLQ